MNHQCHCLVGLNIAPFLSFSYSSYSGISKFIMVSVSLHSVISDYMLRHGYLGVAQAMMHSLGESTPNSVVVPSDSTADLPSTAVNGDLGSINDSQTKVSGVILRSSTVDDGFLSISVGLITFHFFSGRYI